ncbi:MAG: rod shape-determining protein MreC [Rhodoferax sp.]|nr:rod shape-determining protein MreC [Rhodoferax sp.]OIP22344.1 MAG: rod shape-determining protein MreC [Comamonadaceae bacterium CG2_30_60_41]PIW09914.1 MAG: rod shape-determining protein MreC [Comamonadaceae bacterium CG17_big_fil_post_rev_8_21_14_2_50_60_13]PIY27130.1 MAG: rod shape-determining protein MreC [Comamonadaceae bacterium CG_4_10_14_3_um_filter_60_75]PJC17875.1 MAG: rod shape-determining protein MreC [Comamonadaceae bacterium CG_4_9_14_0_8_um_filter_60_18]
MPLGTLESSPPPFFRQGPSALSKLVFFGVLSLLLMVADLRFQVAQPIRSTLATVLYPLQWAVLRPFVWLQDSGRYFESLQNSQADAASAQYRLGLQSQRAQQVEQLTLENTRLRQLLELRARVNTPALAAQVLYDAADPFTKKIIIDQGALAAVVPGSPVIDEVGVLGQVTRVYPLVSEVTLVTDRNQSIPVLNARTGVRALAFGDASVGGELELRFLDANVDMQAGDVLTTSGIDGVYPPGLQVARVKGVARQSDSTFAHIRCEPLAQVSGALHVLVLKPVQLTSAPLTPEPIPLAAKKPRGKP